MKKIINSVLFMVCMTVTAHANEIILSKTGNAVLDGVYTKSVNINDAPSFIKITEGGTFRIAKFKIASEKKGVFHIGWLISDANGKEYFAANGESTQPPAEGWDVGRSGIGFNVNFDLTFRDVSAKIAALTLTNTAVAAVKIFPNPTMGDINIESNSLIQSVSVVNSVGKTVMTATETRINVSNLPAGTYGLIIQTEKGKIVRKIVKQ